MFTLLGLVIISIWFYYAAKNVNKSGVLWLLIGIMFYFIMGFTLLEISEKFVLHINTISDTISMEWPKRILELISMVIILSLAYLIYSGFLSKKQRIKD